MFYETEQWTCPLCGHKGDALKNEKHNLIIRCAACGCNILYRNGEPIGKFTEESVVSFERIGYAA